MERIEIHNKNLSRNSRFFAVPSSSKKAKLLSATQREERLRESNVGEGHTGCVGGGGGGGCRSLFQRQENMAWSPFLFCSMERDKIIHKVKGINKPEGADTFQDLCLNCVQLKNIVVYTIVVPCVENAIRRGFPR